MLSETHLNARSGEDPAAQKPAGLLNGADDWRYWRGYSSMPSRSRITQAICARLAASASSDAWARKLAVSPAVWPAPERLG